MKKDEHSAPSKLALKFFRWYCRPEMSEELEGDLLETHKNRVNHGKPSYLLALSFWWDVIRCCRPYAWKRSQEKGNSLALYQTYLKLTLRHAWKNKGPVAINILGLGLSLGFCISIYLMQAYNVEFDSFFENTDKIYRLHSIRIDQGHKLRYELTPLAMAQVLNEELSAVENDASYSTQRVTVKRDQSYFSERVGFISSGFLSLFKFPLKNGDYRKEVEQGQVMLTETSAEKYYGSENPVGKHLTVYINGTKLEVTVAGVFQKIPLNSSFQFQMLLSQKDFLQAQSISNGDWSNGIKVGHYLKLSDGVDVKNVEPLLQAYIKRQNETEESWKVSRFELIPFVDTILSDDQMNGGYANNRLRPEVLVIFWFMIILILFTACFNMANTAIALLAKRLKEIGIRKTLGSSSRQVFLQFMFEMLITSLLAFIVAFSTANFISTSIWSLFDVSFLLEDISVKAILIFVALFLTITTLVAGLFPALYAWKFNPVTIIGNRAQLKGVGLLHKSLMSAQYGFSITVLIAGFIFSQNADFIEEFNVGYDQEQLIDIPIHNNSAFTAIKDNILQLSGALAVTGTRDHIGKSPTLQVLEIDTAVFEVEQYAVGNEYLQVMGVPILEGRYFNTNSAYDEKKAVIVNESFALKYGINGDPLDMTIKIDDQVKVIVGVVSNLVKSVYSDYEYRPVVYTLIGEKDYGHLVVKSNHGQTTQLEREIQPIWAGLTDEPYQGRLQTDLAFAFAVRDSKNLKQIFLWSAWLGCFLCIAGIYSLASLSVAKKRKEISIRKTLGATVNELIFMIGRSFWFILGSALILGVSAGYFISDSILSTIYRFHIEASFGLSLLAGMVVIFLAMVMITLASFGPALSNPVNGLRDD